MQTLAAAWTQTSIVDPEAHSNWRGLKFTAMRVNPTINKYTAMFIKNSIFIEAETYSQGQHCAALSHLKFPEANVPDNFIKA